LIRIGDTGKEYFLLERFSSSGQLRTQYLRSIDFGIQKGPPGLRMSSESLHEAGVAVHTSMYTSGVRIDYIAGQAALLEDTFHLDRSYAHGDPLTLRLTRQGIMAA
jgi:hypothetical protein